MSKGYYGHDCGYDKYDKHCHYDKSDKCLRDLKKHAHAVYASPTDKYFDKAYHELGHALKHYEDAFKSRQCDKYNADKAYKATKCLEYYDKWKFNDPHCRHIKKHLGEKMEELDTLENKSYYHAEQAYKSLYRARKVNYEAKKLGMQYIDCATCGRHPGPYYNGCKDDWAPEDEWAPQVNLGLAAAAPVEFAEDNLSDLSEY